MEEENADVYLYGGSNELGTRKLSGLFSSGHDSETDGAATINGVRHSSVQRILNLTCVKCTQNTYESLES